MHSPSYLWRSRRKSLLLSGLILLLAFSVACGSAGKSSTSSPTQIPTPGPAAPATTAPTVSILSPQANSTVTGPVRVQATVSINSSLKLLLDGTQIWADQATALDTTISAGDGQHHLCVQATDSTGTVTEAAVDFIAASAPREPSPAFSVVIDRIEEQSAWLTCGNCGNTGGSVGNTATYLMERGISLPSLDSSAARYSIGGSYSYANAYWYIRQPAPATRINNLRYEFDLFIPAEFASAPQAIEFECQQQIGGYIYNFAWQAEYPQKIWRTFDYVNRRWDSTSVAVNQLTPDQWHHIVAEYHTTDTTVVHDALTIDGTRYDVGVTHSAKYVGGTSKALTNAFQLDLNKAPTPYSVYVDGMKVSYN